MREKLFEFLKLTMYPVFIFLNIDIQVVKILCYLMIADGIFGGIKSYKLYKNFEFKALIWGFVTKIIILIMPALLALVGIGIGKDFTIFVDVAFKAMILNEFYSILGHAYSIKTGREVKRVDVITMIIKASRDAIYRLIQNTITKIEVMGDCEKPKK